MDTQRHGVLSRAVAAQRLVASLLEHSGSIASLEDWFDPERLRKNYVPTGWVGPGVKTRAVPGHEFGLDLPADDKQALSRS